MGCNTGCGNGILGWGGGWGNGCGGGCGGCGGCGDDRRIAVITAVRAVVAKGEGCFDGRW
jgi:hypothetical protein